MNIRRSALALLLCLVLSLLLLPNAAFADELEEEELFEITVEQEPESYVPGGENDNDELLDAYVQKQLDSQLPRRRALRYVHSAGGDLTGVNSAVYQNLKTHICAVAAGEESSTVFEIPVSELGLSQTSWTAAELGLSTLVENGTFSAEAMAAVNARVGFTLREVVSALLADCPYELYWYDKTVGTSYQPYSFSGTRLSIGISGKMTFTFAVSTEFDDGTYVTVRNADGSTTRYYCGVDSSLITGVADALATAAQIVADYAGSDDYNKLLGYKNEICSLTSYNTAAASGSVEYGNPWQIIYVFDGDVSTKVVCEGYAKAFQYLCDLTQFSGGVSAYTVTGTMSGGTGAGAHMWNIVHMENGRNYLVDVTNSDAGTVGSPDKLFLAGHSSGGVDSGYTFVANNIPITYFYESKMRAIFSDSDLTVSGSRYLDDISEPPAGTVLTMAHLEQAIADFLDSGASSTEIQYTGTGSFIVDRDVTIPTGMRFTLPNGTLYVDEGVTMTVALGATVNARHANIDGTLTVLGTFSMRTASSVLTVGGRLDNRGSVLILDPNFQRTANMKANGGRYYVEHYASDEAAIRSACGIAAEDTDSAVTHEIYLQAQIALTQDLTVPANVRMRIAAGTSLSYGSGVTLTLNGRIETRTDFVGLGTTVNNGLLALMRNNGVTASAQFGVYEGGGVLKVYADTENPFDHITGLDPQYFSSTLDVDNYWALSLVAYTVDFMNYDDTLLLSLSVPHGSMPEYSGETPVKPYDEQYSYTFTGWSPELVPATADAVYTAQFSSTERTVVDSGECGAQGDNVIWELYNDGVLVISGSGAMFDSPAWALDPDEVSSVVIEQGVTSIPSWGFEIFQYAGSVSIPASVTAIGEGAFGNCLSLTDISVDTGNAAYASVDGVLFNAAQTELICCPGGKSGAYTVPAGVTSIGDWAFLHCHGLTGIVIPEGVTGIGGGAFMSCINLPAVSIPASVTEIGYGAFAYCDSLPGLSVDAGNLSYVSVNGVLFNAAQTELIYCPGGKNGAYTVPAGVTGIADWAFAGCYYMTDIELPASVTEIGVKAFECCINLTDFAVPASVTSIGAWGFRECNGLTGISLPVGLMSIGEGAFENCGSLTGVVFGGTQAQRAAREGEGWSTSGNSALFNAVWSYFEHPAYDCTLPEALTVIEEEAMEGCAFRAVYIPNGVTSIGARAFAASPDLEYVYIPESVTSIASDAFDQVTGLTVIGTAGSTAESFALAQGFPFIED